MVLHSSRLSISRFRASAEAFLESKHRVETPEGWIKKVDRAREGKVWVGYFHVWEQKPDGTRVRRRKEKTLGPATKPKHEALKELSDYIAEYTSEAPKQAQPFIQMLACHLARVLQSQQTARDGVDTLFVW